MDTFLILVCDNCKSFIACLSTVTLEKKSCEYCKQCDKLNVDPNRICSFKKCKKCGK